MLSIYINSLILFIDCFTYCSTHSTIIHLNKTFGKSTNRLIERVFYFLIEYHITRTKESLDLTISHQFLLENCTYSFLTLVELISFYSSIIKNTTILIESLTTLKLINLCIYIDIKSLEQLKSIRRLIFENCSIHFMASQQREDYDFYPKNLSRWSFNQGRTYTFAHFITMINQLGTKLK